MRLIMIRSYSFCLVLPARDIFEMRLLMPRPWELNPLFHWARLELLARQLLAVYQSKESLVFTLQERRNGLRGRRYPKRNGLAITARNKVIG